MFSYTTAVFGLKHNQPLSKLTWEFKQLRRQNVVVFEHNEEDENICGRPFVHYHGIFERSDDLFSFENDDDICAIKNSCCYFKSADCCNPEYDIAVLRRLSMKCVTSLICKPSNLFTYNKENGMYENSITFENDLNVFKNLIIPEKIFRPIFLNYNISKYTGLHSAITDLCTTFNSNEVCNDFYLSPEESSSYVIYWCVSQNLSPEIFVKDWINCLDRKVTQKNVLYFQGPRDSYVTDIVNSVSDACGHFSYKKMQDTTGYSYFWNNCIGKRLITLVDPHFDAYHCCDKLLEVFEGLDSHVKINGVENDYFSLMKPTPVVIIAREHGWEDNCHIEMNIKERMIHCYDNLRSVLPPLKRLHPLWLTILDARYRIFRNGQWL